MTEPDPFDELVLDEEFIKGGVAEAPADERIAKMRRIARSNDRLRTQGEIADGSGKPKYQRLRKSAPWIAIAVVVSIAIVVIAVIAT